MVSDNMPALLETFADKAPTAWCKAQAQDIGDDAITNLWLVIGHAPTHDHNIYYQL